VDTEDPGAVADGWSAFTTWVEELFASGWSVPLRVLMIVLVAFLIRLLLQVLIRRSVDRIVTGVKKRYEVDETRQLTAQSPVSAVRRVQRTRSLGRVFSSAVTWTVVVLATFLVFYTLFPGATSAFAIVAAAVGAGLGIGAQGLVKDVMNGIFLVSEDQLGIGDVVDLGLASGVVEDVGIRVTKVRDVHGTLWFVRNGEIARVGNQSQGWARAIIDLAVPYDDDIEAIKVAILDAGKSLADDPAWRARLLGEAELWGIESISSEAIVLRVVVKTRTSAKDDVSRELRARIKARLDARQIHLPSVMSIRLDGDGVTGGTTGGAPTKPIPKAESKPRTRPTPKPDSKSTPKPPARPSKEDGRDG